jgi:hypothetical protein
LHLTENVIIKNIIGLIFLLTLLSWNKDDEKGIFSYDFTEKSKIDVSTDPKFPIKFRDWENTTFQLLLSKYGKLKRPILVARKYYF